MSDRQNTTDPCVTNEGGNCQHVVSASVDDRWTIPSGTHIFFGTTVSVSGSTDSAATEAPSVSQVLKQQEEHLADDLQRQVSAARSEAETKAKHSDRDVLDILEKKLMIRLAVFIVGRDHKILGHGFNIGLRAGMAEKRGFENGDGIT